MRDVVPLLGDHADDIRGLASSVTSCLSNEQLTRLLRWFPANYDRFAQPLRSHCQNNEIKKRLNLSAQMSWLVLVTDFYLFISV